MLSPIQEDDVFVGLDVSLTDTGLVLLSSGGEVLKALSIKTTADMLDMSRTRHIANSVVDTIESYSSGHRIYIMIEAIPFSRNPTGKTYTRVEVIAVIKWELLKRGYPVYMVTATTLKKQFAGKGNKDKDAVKLACREKYNLNISNDNVADALAAADSLKRYILERARFPLEKMPEA